MLDQITGAQEASLDGTNCGHPHRSKQRDPPAEALIESVPMGREGKVEEIAKTAALTGAEQPP